MGEKLFQTQARLLLRCHDNSAAALWSQYPLCPNRENRSGVRRFFHGWLDRAAYSGSAGGGGAGRGRRRAGLAGPAEAGVAVVEPRGL